MELNQEHQQVAEAAKARIMEIISRTRVLAAEVIVGDSDELR